MLVFLLSDYNDIESMRSLLNDECKIKAAFKCFNDEMSQRIYLRRLYSSLAFASLTVTFADVMTTLQYYPDEIIRLLSEEEVFLDLGAYNGDTINQFIKMANDHYKHIYALEMDSAVYKELKSNFIAQEKITCFPYGASNKSAEVHYNNKGYASSSYIRVNKSDIANMPVAKLKSIDEMITDGEITYTPTYIKMDIEGAEMDALQGLSQTIIKHKPKLAVCVYHSRHDLWRLPLYIKSLVPEYKMILRHHSSIHRETVMYAYI